MAPSDKSVNLGGNAAFRWYNLVEVDGPLLCRLE